MMNEELTAINSPHNNARRRKGAIAEINQVAVLLNSLGSKTPLFSVLVLAVT
jgi:hypothetical protein